MFTVQFITYLFITQYIAIFYGLFCFIRSKFAVKVARFSSETMWLFWICLLLFSCLLFANDMGSSLFGMMANSQNKPRQKPNKTKETVTKVLHMLSGLPNQEKKIYQKKKKPAKIEIDPTVLLTLPKITVELFYFLKCKYYTKTRKQKKIPQTISVF